ncbi:hypothetical protein LXL04_006532 [Taraxacum kok-saghyz]
MQNTISFLKKYDTNDWLRMCYTLTHYFSGKVHQNRVSNMELGIAARLKPKKWSGPDMDGQSRTIFIPRKQFLNTMIGVANHPTRLVWDYVDEATALFDGSHPSGYRQNCYKVYGLLPVRRSPVSSRSDERLLYEKPTPAGVSRNKMLATLFHENLLTCNPVAPLLILKGPTSSDAPVVGGFCKPVKEGSAGDFVDGDVAGKLVEGDVGLAGKGCDPVSFFLMKMEMVVVVKGIFVTCGELKSKKQESESKKCGRIT